MNCLLKLLPSFCYKGDRNYVHGTSIISYLQESRELSQNNLILESIRFTRLLQNQPLVYIFDSHTPMVPKAINPIFFDGSLVSQENRELHYAFIGINSNNPITSRLSYDESNIVNNCFRSDSYIALDSPTNNLFIEEVVALMKLYCNYKKPPATGEKWLFGGTKLLSQLPLKRSNSTTLTLEKFQFLANSFAKSNIYYDNKLIGSINFATASV